MASTIGWDVGGVHTKAVLLQDGQFDQIRHVSRPFEIWRAPSELPGLLRLVHQSLEMEQPDAMAVTMTAELSDIFQTKRQGVLFVLDAFRQAFPRIPIHLLNLASGIETLDSACHHPADFAAANWLASALFVAHLQPDCLLVDMGSTTTDLTPIQDGRILSTGRTDTGRLAAGELVYTGVVRTNPNTLVSRVPIEGELCPVAAESFAVMGDVYLLLGLLEPQAYTTPTPDGQPKTGMDCHRRLARLVCADAESLSSGQIVHLARYLHEKQLQQVSEAAWQVLSRVPGPALPLCAVGSGRWLADSVGQRLGLPSIALGLPDSVLEVLPCVAVAHLVEEHLASGAL